MVATGRFTSGRRDDCVVMRPAAGLSAASTFSLARVRIRAVQASSFRDLMMHKATRGSTLLSMQLDEIVTEALKLHPRSRAQLAGTLLQSLDELTAEQNEEIWAEEAATRDLAPQATDRPADEVFKELRGQLK